VPAAPITDYHEAVRDAAKAAIQAALDAAAYPVPVAVLDDPESDLAKTVSMPAVVVFCVGPEQDRPEMSTNARDGVGLTVGVAGVWAGVTSGSGTPRVPTPTAFRRLVRTTFNNQRLAGVPEVGWCEVSDLGPVFDKDSPAFQKLAVGLAVTAVGRWPRTDA
jgi:hypothetical protein